MGRRSLSLCTALIALIVQGTGMAAPDGESSMRFYGYAYDLKSNNYLYTELHHQRIRDGRWLGGTIDYFAPNGQPLARKILDFSADPYVPEYELTEFKRSYREGIRQSGGRWQMFRQDPGKAEEVAPLNKTGAMAADSGFHAIINAYLPKILAGEVLRFKLAAAGRLDHYRFKVTRDSERRFEGRPAVLLLAEVDSLLSLLSAPLELLYDPDSGRLLEYRGLSNLHDPAKGRLFDVRIAYYSTPPSDAPKLPPLN